MSRRRSDAAEARRLADAAASFDRLEFHLKVFSDILRSLIVSLKDDIKKARRQFKAIKDAEEQEDAAAATYRTEQEAKVSALQAQIAELMARPTLDEEDRTELQGLMDELSALAPAEPEPEPEPAPPDVEPEPPVNP
jgi:DNA integrity scanning protein DisA with diadenylate cyclase activity